MSQAAPERVCPDCGTPVSDGMFCPNCGAVVNSAPEPQPGEGWQHAAASAESLPGSAFEDKSLEAPKAGAAWPEAESSVVWTPGSAGSPGPAGPGASGEQPTGAAGTGRPSWFARMTSGQKAGLVAVVAVIIAAAIAIPLALSSSSKSYPANVQNNFLNACEANSSAGRCQCMLQWTENHISFAEFSRDDTAMRNGGSAPGWLVTAATSCAGK